MLNDVHNRPLKDLRISVTDRCNFRCTYCMPLDEYDWVDKQEILTFEKIVRLANVFVGLGVTKIRLTGGEPLIRKDLHRLIQKLARISGLEDLSLTTNGSLLAEQVADLAKAGLQRVNVSLDTLDPEKFKRMTKRGDLQKVLAGLFAAKAQPHRHNADVFVYVLEGSIITQLKGASPQTARAGDVIYESPTDMHSVTRNASHTVPAKILAFYVKKKGAPEIMFLEEGER